MRGRGGWGGKINDPYALIQSGKADAVLVAPSGGFTKAMGRGKARLQFLVDASNASKARIIEAYAVSIIKQFAARGSPAGGGVSLDVRLLYNPSMKSSIFLVPGVMCMILCLLTIILTSMSMAKEKEIGTFEMIISAPLGIGEILLGKTIPYILLGIADTFIILAAGMVLFSVPMRGPLLMLAVSAFVFVVATVGIGTLISTISKTQQQAMMGGFLFLFPAVLMSGIMFPVENMPSAIIWVAYLDPLKYFVTLMRNIMLKGGDFQVFISNISVLTAMAVFAAVLSYKRFKQTLN